VKYVGGLNLSPASDHEAIALQVIMIQMIIIVINVMPYVERFWRERKKKSHQVAFGRRRSLSTKERVEGTNAAFS